MSEIFTIRSVRYMVIFLCLCGVVEAEWHVWTSHKGSKIHAMFVDYQPDFKLVKLKRKRGGVIEVRMDHLDQASQNLVLKLHEESGKKKQTNGAAQQSENRIPDKKAKVYLDCDFSSRRWWKDWKLDEKPENFDLVKSDPEGGMNSPHTGKYALRVRVEEGKHAGGSLQYWFRRQPEQMYFRYYLLLGKNWQYSGKMPGWGGTYKRAGWGGRKSDGKNGWSARGGGATSGELFRLSSYCYHADMRGSYGDTWFWDHPGIEKGRWYCVEQFCKINTPGQKDGVIRVWIDGKQVFEKTDIRMRDTEKLKIENVWFNFYHGGKDTAPRTCYAYLDDIVISNQYIGPVSEVKE